MRRTRVAFWRRTGSGTLRMGSSARDVTPWEQIPLGVESVLYYRRRLLEV